MSSRRPTQVPRWAWGVSATLVQPPTLSAENGFAAAQRPPAPWFNWQFNALGAWVDFLRGPNTSQWARTAWGTSPGSYDSSSLVLLAVDATTLDATGAAYRIVIAGWETSGPTTTLHVSQTGAAWTRRTNTPGGVGNPTALAHLNNTARWILADDTPALWYAPHDAGAGTSPVGGSSSGWLACTATDDGGGSLTAFKAIASNTTHAVALTSGGGLYSADGITWDPITESTPRVGNGRDVVWTGAAFVYITANGEVYASPTANGSFALKTTLPDGSADWRLAAGDAGEVLAYQHNLGAASDLWHSTNNGNTWAALTPLAAGRDVERLTCVRWHDGVWMATSSVAPFLWTSNDGTNWIALKPDVSGAGALQAIAWDGSSWLAAGNGFVVRCPRGADPAPGDYVADGSPATLADAATLRGRRITTSSPSDGDTLTWNATAEEWEYGPGGSSPTLAEGDLIIRGASADERLAIGGAGKVLTSNGTTATWEVGSPITIADITDAGATGASVLAAATAADGRAALGVDAESLAAELAHTPTSATMRFLWHFATAGSTAASEGTVSGSDLTLGGTAAQNALLLASLNGRGLSLDGTPGAWASGGANKDPGVTTGITWWCVFTVTTPPPARRATVFTRNFGGTWGAPYLSISIMVEPSTAPGASRAIVTSIGGVSSGYLEHITSAAYVDGVQMSVVVTLNGTAWKVYVNGALVNTYSNGEAVMWGSSGGYWQVGANGQGDTVEGHVTEAGCDARVWTADDVIELEQRRLGRWRG